MGFIHLIKIMSWGDHDHDLIRKKLNVSGRKKNVPMKSDNELIANFMGINFDGFVTVTNWTPPKYDEYWEQLMPVVSKIEELGFAFAILQFTASVRPFSYMGDFPVVYHTEDTKLKAAHKCVVKFINWYNAQ